MAAQSELQLENALIDRLTLAGWNQVSINSEQELWGNLKSQLEAQNATTFTDSEFGRIRLHLEGGTVFEKAGKLRERYLLQRDDGTTTHITFFNSEEWCRNRYQVANQITIKGLRKTRFDVTLLINGIPLCQIELKRPGVELKAAFNQVNRYHKDSYKYAGGLFQYTQIFVISNGVNTLYYANNQHQSFKQTFTWADDKNSPINRLNEFADVFLEKCHLSKMIARYTVLHRTLKILMVMRPYQYYATEAITDAVMYHRGNGYIWHTTGSGKTLTSFKAAQNLVSIPKLDKIIFVVDRADLDYQTTKEFNAFKEGCVDETKSTRHLVQQLADPTTRLTLTTIQKLNTALSGDHYKKELAGILNGRVIFIFDECHRSQFGEAHKRIRAAFPRAQMFGFTGTPILAENAIDKKTTMALFDRQLHCYTITDAIRDHNVLKFGVEYYDATARDVSEMSPAAARKLLEHPARIEAVTEWIVANHNAKTHQRRYSAIMAVSSVEMLIAYYEAFRTMKVNGQHDLNIATIFTYATNEEDPDATGFIPDDEFPTTAPAPAMMPKRDALVSFVKDYNATFGTNENVMSGEGFYAYYRSIGERMKRRDKSPPIERKDAIDILLVVNMFLTGFDAQTCNTIYVDKNLRYHGLVQAFSRTNRIIDAQKSQGNVVCFRDLRKQVDEAIALFANKDAKSIVLMDSYEEYLEQYQDAVDGLLLLTPDPDSVDGLPDENAQEAFVKAFRTVVRVKNILESFSVHQPENIEGMGIPAHVFEEYKSKYLDLSERSSGGKGDDEDDPHPLSEIDFDLELISRIEINVAYILALLTKLTTSIHSSGFNSDEAEELRTRIYNVLSSEPQFLRKKDVIQDFIDTELSGLAPDSDVPSAFKAYWSERRIQALNTIAREENLDKERFDAMLQAWLFTGRIPTTSEVMHVCNQKPTITKQTDLAKHILRQIEEVQDVFDYGMGE